MNIIERIFGKKEDVETPPSYLIYGYEKDWLKKWHERILNSRVMVTEFSRSTCSLQLVRVLDMNLDTYFLIQAKSIDDGQVFTIQTFFDDDTEYAENCAREAFDYLTKEI